MDKAFNISDTVMFPSNLAQLIEDDDGFPHVYITHNDPSHNIQRMHFYVPDSLLLDDSAQYEGLSTQLSKVRELGKAKGDDFTKADKEAAMQQTLNNVLGGATTKFFAQDNLTRKVAINPMMEMAFTSMGMRSFKLDLAMTPNNADEAMSIIAIINCFRELMYPAKTADEETGVVGTGFTLQYPAMWRIQFMVGENESHFMPTFYDSYLASLNTNYRGQAGAFIQVKDGNATDYIGQRIDITLGFSEAKQLTRNDIYQGGRPIQNADRLEIPAGSTASESKDSTKGGDS